MMISQLPADVSLIDEIDRWAQIDPRRSCLVFGEEMITYQGLRMSSALIAGELIDLGLAHGKRIAVLSPNHIRGMLVTVGILRAGSTWLPLNPRDSAEHTADLLNRMACDALIIHSSFEPMLDVLRSRATNLKAIVSLRRGA